MSGVRWEIKGEIMKQCKADSVKFSTFVAKKGIPVLQSGGLRLILFCLPDEGGLTIIAALSVLNGGFRGPSSGGSWNEQLNWRPCGGGNITWKKSRLQQRRPRCN